MSYDKWLLNISLFWLIPKKLVILKMELKEDYFFPEESKNFRKISKELILKVSIFQIYKESLHWLRKRDLFVISF